MQQPRKLSPDPHIEALGEELRHLPRHLWDERLWAFCEAYIKDAERRERRAAMKARRGPGASSARAAAIHKLRPVHSRPN